MMRTNTSKKTRLGELLLEKNIITMDQLKEAISCQQSSQRQLGEILIEKKLVSKWQINRTLKMQKYLRSALLTSVLSLAPLMLTGCGGGGGGGSSSNLSSPTAAEQQQDQQEAQDIAKLSWSLPSQRADGSELELYEIETFRIYHTSEDGSVEGVYEVDGDETELNLDNLPTGKHFFAISVVDSNGLESDLSEAVSKEII